MPGWDACKHPAMLFDSDLDSASRAAKTFENLYKSLPMPVNAKTVPVTLSMTDFRARSPLCSTVAPTAHGRPRPPPRFSHS